MSAESQSLPYESLGPPIRGPRALGDDRRRFWHLTFNIARTEWKLRFFGSVLGYLSSFVFHIPAGLCALLGAGAVLSATTQGPISTVVLIMELTGTARSSILPLILAATVATMISRSIEPRSIYDARLTSEQIALRQRQRNRVQVGPELPTD